MECDTETAWAAGLFEGEGTVFLSVRPSRSSRSDRRERRQPQLVLSMTDRDVVERFATWAGVSRIYMAKRPQPHHKTLWIVKTSRASTVRHLLVRMMPYLMSRRLEKAALVADYLSDTLAWRGTDERGLKNWNNWRNERGENV